MKTLFYTRLEGNTGGDEAFLNVFKDYMLKNITEQHHQIHLCITYDEISKERAEKVKKSWLDELSKKNLTGEVWLFLTNERSLEKSIPGIRNKYVQFKKVNANNLNVLDPSIDWYIHEMDSDRYYLLRSGSKQKLELPKTGNSLRLTAKTCFFSKQLSNNPADYPLLVLTEEPGIDEKNPKRELAYYNDIGVTSPEIFPVLNYSKKIKSIVSDLEKKNNNILKLTDAHISNLKAQFGFLPDEFLITKEEMDEIKSNLQFPPKVLEQIEEWYKFKELTRSLNTLVFAGWAHLQNQFTAKHLKREFELPTECRILLSCVPGMSINGFEFVTGLINHTDFRNIHVLQTGIRGNGGFPMISKLAKEEILAPKTRQAWLNHIGNDFKEKAGTSGKKQSDKLIVIYCSKDAPGDAGKLFLQEISQELNKTDELPENWPVILVGTDTESRAYTEWQYLCNERLFPLYPIPRTETTEILMRGLHDAKYAMATGSYSILEARYLGIDHCEYLAPVHMRLLTAMLNAAKKEKNEKHLITEEEGMMHQTFLAGKTAGEELSKYLLPNCNESFFHISNAWSITAADEIVKYIMEAKNKPLPMTAHVSSSEEDNIEIASSYSNRF
ncbi:hypothetical protein [Legionella rowbothamii]|uniref:hypothetical protein n=1 Tax=Legionella rowbothamii TaxID=96229 RepID=UPI0010569DC2|nr:hypothetical protein [Legionella rowbothamii]